MTGETYMKILSGAVLIGGIIITAVTVYLVLEPAFRSDEEQAKIDQQKLEAKEQTEQKYQKRNIAAGLKLANSIVYVQDTRTGICFATKYARGHNGHFTAVDCDMIPVEMLNKTED